MAKEVLDKIRHAEEKAQETINTTQITARELVRAANEKADKLLADNAAEIKAETAKILSDAEAEAIKEFDAEKDALRLEIEGKRRAAEKQLKNVREYILGRIL